MGIVNIIREIERFRYGSNLLDFDEDVTKLKYLDVLEIKDMILKYAL